MHVVVMLRAVAASLQVGEHESLLDPTDAEAGIKLCHDIIALLRPLAGEIPTISKSKRFNLTGASELHRLEALPPELLSRVIMALESIGDVGRLICCSHTFCPKLPPPSGIEEGMRLRAERHGWIVPKQVATRMLWIQQLCWDERRRVLRKEGAAGGGETHAVFVDSSGCLLTSGFDIEEAGVLGHGSGVTRLEVPTAVPALMGVCIRSISVGDYHTLALTQAGAVFSFGAGDYGKVMAA